jgi:hypothetical protein
VAFVGELLEKGGAQEVLLVVQTLLTAGLLRAEGLVARFPDAQRGHRNPGEFGNGTDTVNSLLGFFH